MSRSDKTVSIFLHGNKYLELCSSYSFIWAILFSFPQSLPLSVAFTILYSNIKRKVNSFFSALDVLDTILGDDYTEGN